MRALAQSVWCPTRVREVPGSIPGPTFRFLRFISRARPVRRHGVDFNLCLCVTVWVYYAQAVAAAVVGEEYSSETIKFRGRYKNTRQVVQCLFHTPTHICTYTHLHHSNPTSLLSLCCQTRRVHSNRRPLGARATAAGKTRLKRT